VGRVRAMLAPRVDHDPLPGGERRGRTGHHEGMDGLGQVLHLARADVVEPDRDFVRHGLVHGARDADPARRRDALEARGDVHAVAETIVPPLDDVADRDADAERDAPVGRGVRGGRREAVLDIDRDPDRLDGRVELAHHRIAGRVEDPSAGAMNEAVEDIARGRKTVQRPFLVLGDKARIAGDVGREDRGDLTFQGRAG
jgi:hypothetical protein